ncbi:MAG: hypothetical protein ACRC54_01890 [Fusobacteriaceae bacterium]
MERRMLFIGEYPDKFNIKDGMIRRIKQVDNKFQTVEREYLDIKFLKNLIRKEIKNENGVLVYKLNFFKDIFFINKKIKEYKNIYIHSLLNYARTFIFFEKLKNDIKIDIHGAVVEEMSFNKKEIKSKILGILEKKMFNTLTHVIFVNNKMKDFYCKKYKNLNNDKIIILPIMDENLLYGEENSIQLEGKKINIIYCGNLQKWQNIDLMLKKLKEVENEMYNYIFLTNEKEKFLEKLEEVGLKNYFLDSVDPSDLKQYYEKAHYGLLLRDEHILNSVANPTKLTEYLSYGIIPIVKFEEIGDYKELGYEYLKIENMTKNLPLKKSKKNIEIIKKIQKEIKNIEFKKIILGEK